jgi:transcriptional adapter 2-alpha
MFGFGNWDDISRHVGSKTTLEAQRHFQKCYQDPKHNDILNEGLSDVQLKFQTKGDFMTLQQKVQQIVDFELKQHPKAGACDTGTGLYGQVVGYMPLRNEFDVEFDNEAELYLAELEFTPQDTEETLKIKEDMLLIYNRKLEEREKRKAFVVENQLLDLKRTF